MDQRLGIDVLELLTRDELKGPPAPALVDSIAAVPLTQTRLANPSDSVATHATRSRYLAHFEPHLDIPLPHNLYRFGRATRPCPVTVRGTGALARCGSRHTARRHSLPCRPSMKPHNGAALPFEIRNS